MENINSGEEWLVCLRQSTREVTFGIRIRQSI